MPASAASGAVARAPRALVVVTVLALLVVDSASRGSCRRPPIPSAIRASRATQPRGFAAQQDADGIVRTWGGCFSPDGLECELCCDGACCEEVGDAAVIAPHLQLWVPLRFVLIESTASPRVISSADLAFQLDVVNRAFAETPFRFIVDSVDKVVSERMAASCNTDPCYVDPSTCDFYHYTMPQVRRNSESVVTVVVCALPYFGEAQFPWATVEDSPEQYVQVSTTAFANWSATAAHAGGYTLVHELGHYFGLLHTFERTWMCDMMGDYVDDTPSSSTPARASEPCDFVRNSCPNDPGVDDHTNFMNYASDECGGHFTEGQRKRMQQAVTRYRPIFTARRAVAGECPATGSYTLGEPHCRCADPTLTPQALCRAVDEGTNTASSSPLFPPTPVPELTASPERGGASSSNGGISNVALVVIIVLACTAVIAGLVALGVFLAIRQYDRKQAKLQLTMQQVAAVVPPAAGPQEGGAPGRRSRVGDALKDRPERQNSENMANEPPRTGI